ncbi:unnamed protein product [Scytosiphon promiscuus]
MALHKPDLQQATKVWWLRKMNDRSPRIPPRLKGQIYRPTLQTEEDSSLGLGFPAPATSLLWRHTGALRLWEIGESPVMGISGLLPFLKSVTYPIHISEYRGLTAGIDAYCWLHRGAFSCGTELCTGVATDRYVTFCMKRVNLLLDHGVRPIMVFDGASLPMKRDRNLERRRQREMARSRGEAALTAGEAGAAAQHFSKAVGVTHDMAFHFMKALRQAGVELIVAPYEADAQLAFLSRTGAVDVVISEDSDCLPYGCKKVLFKMDNDGHGQEIQLRNLSANRPLSLSNWKNSMFLDLCLLVGCDYISASIKGLGIATAHKLVDRHRSLDKIINAVKSSKFVVPEGYWAQYRKARVTFRHHIIYNPHTKTTMHLMPLGDTAKDLDNLDFLGIHLQPPVAHGVGCGRLLPTTHQPYEAEARLDHSFPCRSAPSRAATVLALESSDATAENPVDSPAAETSCISQPNTQYGGEDGEAQGAGGPPVQGPIPGAFIDSPFCASRPALRELAPPGHDGAASGCYQEYGWGVPQIDTSIGWATQRDRCKDLPGVLESYSRDGDRWEARGHEKGDFDTNFHSRVAIPEGPMVEETNQGSGLDLTRIRKAELPADPGALGLSATASCTTRGPSSHTVRGDIPSAQQQALCVGSGVHNEEGSGHGMQSTLVDWEGRSRQAGQATGVLWSPRRINDEGTWCVEEGRSGSQTTRQQVLREKNLHGTGGGQAGVRHSDNTLDFMGEPPDADQAKWVPAAAQHFHSTQVCRGLETLQRRKRRLEEGGNPDGPPELLERTEQCEVQESLHESLDVDREKLQGCEDGSGGADMWMIQGTPESPPSTCRSTRRGYEVASTRLMPTISGEVSEARVLTAASRRWTLPSSIPLPGNVDGLPLLRLLDGRREHSWRERIVDTKSFQPLPSPKRVRGTDFWDAQLLP